MIAAHTRFVTAAPFFAFLQVLNKIIAPDIFVSHRHHLHTVCRIPLTLRHTRFSNILLAIHFRQCLFSFFARQEYGFAEAGIDAKRSVGLLAFQAEEDALPVYLNTIDAAICDNAVMYPVGCVPNLAWQDNHVPVSVGFGKFP